MISAPSPTSVALLLGLSFFLGFAFEDFFAHGEQRRPGGIRTFPMLALAGGVLYLFDPIHFIPFTAGLLVLGGWLLVYYVAHVREHDEQGEPNVGLVVPLVNVHAYLLGAIVLALPNWIAVATTVTAVLLLTGRQQLHELARRVDLKEVITAGQFLILTGIILPLLPNEPVTTLTSITPRQVWLALVVVCTFSYVSYLAQRYWAATAGGLWMAALGGLYSSTATTVVLARQAKTDSTVARHAQAGITLATGIMYIRILAIIAIFNMALARDLALPLCILSLIALTICFLQYRVAKPAPGQSQAAGSVGARGERQPARAHSCRSVFRAVRRHVSPLDVGKGAIWNFGNLLARGDRRDNRYRPVRSQSRARRAIGCAGRRAFGGNPDRCIIQQHPQGTLRRIFRGRTSDRRERRRTCLSGHRRRGDRPLYGSSPFLEQVPAGALSTNCLVALKVCCRLLAFLFGLLMLDEPFFGQHGFVIGAVSQCPDQDTASALAGLVHESTQFLFTATECFRAGIEIVAVIRIIMAGIDDKRAGAVIQSASCQEGRDGRAQ